MSYDDGYNHAFKIAHDRAKADRVSEDYWEYR